MERRTGIIVTLGAAFLCGCPGLASLCWGLFNAMIGLAAYTEPQPSIEPISTLAQAAVFTCLGVLFVTIPIVVAVFARRRPRLKSPANFNEPIPPAL